MEKKSEIVVGGEVVDPAAITVSAFGKDLVPVSREYVDTESPDFAATEEITTVDNPRRRSSVPPTAQHLQAVVDVIAALPPGAGIVLISPQVSMSLENAAALRQICGEPDPIPEGALYHVRAYTDTGEPASDVLLDQILGGGTATNLAAPMTHAEAVAVCLDVNGKLQETDSPIWLGVFGVEEAGLP